jgi:tetratricopeptide (TPR) repeat protein
LPSDGRDPLFVAEFDNSTGDTVFDDVLRSVVITELNRSPVVEVVSDSRASELLKSMGKTSEARFTPELARQVCERDKGKYLAEGAIKPQGSAYMIGLTVLECASGGAVSQEQAEAKNIDAVLTTVSGLAAAARLRLSGGDAKSGLDPAPLPTASVRAYKAYIAGEKLVHRQPQQASALLQQATNADPDFAMAWLQLGISDGDLGETKRAADDFTRAFALRNSLGEGGRQWIEAMYYLSATGEVYKAMEALRSWESLNPRATPPHNLLASAYANLGLYQRAVDEFRLSLEVGPEYPVAYMNLSQALLAAGQYDQAATTLDEAPNKDAQWMHERLYQLALLRSDAAGQERERSWMTEHTDDPLVVGMQASMDQFAGDLSASRLHTQRAVQMSLESNLKGSARDMLLAQAEVEALLGESAQAQESAAAALKLSQSREQSGVAWVMALAGQGAEAQQIMDRLVHENPLDTFLNAVDAPLVQAASQLGRGQAAQALHSLEPVKPYEFGGYAGLRPNYLRAMAYLQLRRAKEAAAEFQAVLDHQGVSPMAPEWEMARLGLARAYAMQGNTVKAKTAYQGFLALWKSADSDIPVVNQAKAEYARMGGQF